MSDKSALLPKRPEPPPKSNIPEVSRAIYHDSTQSPTARLVQYLFVGAVILMVLICIILCIVEGVKDKSYGGIYFMLGLCLLGFVAIEIILVLFIRRDHLDRSKLWFVYFVGGVVMLEAIFTNVLILK